MKTIALFGFLLSMAVLITETTCQNNALCNNETVLQGLIPSILYAVRHLLSGIYALYDPLLKIAKTVCEENGEATPCDLLEPLLDVLTPKVIPGGDANQVRTILEPLLGC
ncbi:UNVERIFIED_CONTAM: hypothetical protein RMT77_001031 [Armadillidium vulgare]